MIEVSSVFGEVSRNGYRIMLIIFTFILFSPHSLLIFTFFPLSTCSSSWLSFFFYIILSFSFFILYHPLFSSLYSFSISFSFSNSSTFFTLLTSPFAYSSPFLVVQFFFRLIFFFLLFPLPRLSRNCTLPKLECHSRNKTVTRGSLGSPGDTRSPVALVCFISVSFSSLLLFSYHCPFSFPSLYTSNFFCSSPFTKLVFLHGFSPSLELCLLSFQVNIRDFTAMTNSLYNLELQWPELCASQMNSMDWKSCRKVEFRNLE